MSSMRVTESSGDVIMTAGTEEVGRTFRATKYTRGGQGGWTGQQKT